MNKTPGVDPTQHQNNHLMKKPCKKKKCEMPYLEFEGGEVSHILSLSTVLKQGHIGHKTAALSSEGRVGDPALEKNF